MLPLRSLPTVFGRLACPVGGDEEAPCVDSTGDVGEHEAGRPQPFRRDMGVLDAPCDVQGIGAAGSAVCVGVRDACPWQEPIYGHGDPYSSSV
eukprot:9020293-Heterocapsa_arctica.AAC.1